MQRKLSQISCPQISLQKCLPSFIPQLFMTPTALPLCSPVLPPFLPPSPSIPPPSIHLLPLLLVAAESESGSTSCCKGNSGLGPRPPPRWLLWCKLNGARPHPLVVLHHTHWLQYTKTHHHVGWCKLEHQWCRNTPTKIMPIVVSLPRPIMV